MSIGIDTFRDTAYCIILRGMLDMPLIDGMGECAINRRRRDRNE